MSAGWRRALAPALLVLASLVVCSLLLEIGFRARELWRQYAGVPWAVFDAELGYRLNPAHPLHNAHGFHDRPFPPPSQRFRVLMVGDSLAYGGDDVDDTWVGHLRRMLQQDARLDVDVLNASVAGYTNYQELRWLERDGLALEPDLVGVGFVLNDLYRFLQRLRVEHGRALRRFEATPEALAGDEPPLRDREPASRFLGWLAQRLGMLGYQTSTDPDAFAFEQRIDLRSAWQEAPWRDIRRQLDELATLGRREGFELFLVIFPVAQQYDHRYLARDRAYVLSPQRRLLAICGELALPCLDLYPEIDYERHLLPDGLHLSAAGRRHVAELTVRFLVAWKLVPGLVKPPSRGAEDARGAYVPALAQGAAG